MGKTVKASKRRARWTFSFGAQGQEHVRFSRFCFPYYRFIIINLIHAPLHTKHALTHAQEVILVHSVMSGKKTVTYDGRTVHHAEEMARAFSYSWRDGDHVLRVDISDLVDYGTGRGGDRMYELTVRCGRWDRGDDWICVWACV